MTAPIFVDTNILIYAFDDADLRKQQSGRLWRAEEGQDLDGVIVVNPFRTDPNAFLS